MEKLENGRQNFKNSRHTILEIDLAALQGTTKQIPTSRKKVLKTVTFTLLFLLAAGKYSNLNDTFST